MKNFPRRLACEAGDIGPSLPESVNRRCSPFHRSFVRCASEVARQTRSSRSAACQAVQQRSSVPERAPCMTTNRKRSPIVMQGYVGEHPTAGLVTQSSRRRIRQHLLTRRILRFPLAKKRGEQIARVHFGLQSLPRSSRIHVELDDEFSHVRCVLLKSRSRASACRGCRAFKSAFERKRSLSRACT